eukprot:8203773-Pyramimonas_sp.AAC.1
MIPQARARGAADHSAHQVTSPGSYAAALNGRCCTLAWPTPVKARKAADLQIGHWAAEVDRA